MVHADTWATLPCDLLIEILRRLGSTSTTVIRIAGVCKPWRRAIIDNAWCLRVRPDRFLPHLFPTIVDRTWRSEDVLALKGVAGLDVGLHITTLSSRDGFLLLAAGDTADVNSLCLCNSWAGTCRFLPRRCIRCVQEQLHVHRLISHRLRRVPVLRRRRRAGGTDTRCAGGKHQGRVPYQVFSSTSGAWGPVRRSAKFEIDGVPNLKQVYMLTDPRHVVVCRDSTVYWIVIFITMDRGAQISKFALDIRNGRTWTTMLPETCGMEHCFPPELVLATSRDTRQLSVAVLKGRRWIEVWVLIGDSCWTLQRTMDIQSFLLPFCPGMWYLWLCGFCPRSGYLFGIVRESLDDQDLDRYFLVGVDGRGSPLLSEITIDSNSDYRFPYQMDWSTYISKMKYF